MINITEKTKYKTFYISPKKIKYCVFPSKYCDYTQFNSSKLHPHAGIDRGVFREDVSGYIRINNNNWDDKRGIAFSELLEYKAIQNHYSGKENWKNSIFAKRNVNFIKKNNKVRRFRNYNNFLIKREKQIDNLIESIIKKGIAPVDIKRNKKLFIDNISVNLTKDNKLYFNNRGHHRLSIAKILNLKKIPIKITVAKSIKNLEIFYLKFK